ncbi:MAG: 3-isopropylmalate dehydratase large subunit [Bacteroidetes bacterium]|nr:3-isopropylmalate dehydratase large subunit [Bacteroidota bacterium]
MTLLEKILASHSGKDFLKPGDIADIEIDCRVARDFGGANVVKNLNENGLTVIDPDKTLFTFDCNPTGSDQKYAVNQHFCRLYARENGIRVYDIDAGIGTHILIDQGYVNPGSTAVSTDSHANILGAIGAFGQGMGDMDIAAAWNKGKVWFKVPPSVKINFNGVLPLIVTAKDVALNLLRRFGANSLLGYSIELYGPSVDMMTLDERITISSMATEMGAIIILFPPTLEIISYCTARTKSEFSPVYADDGASYEKIYNIDVSGFKPLVSLPGEPHNTALISEVAGKKIDSAFIGSCTNGRIEDLEAVAKILVNRKTAPGVVLKIVPATDMIWKECMDKGFLDTFKKAGALVSNAGCAGCAAGQVGQNGLGEVTISTGNRNFSGKQGKGSVYLASPAIVAASAIAGFITTPDEIPDEPEIFIQTRKQSGENELVNAKNDKSPKDNVIEGRIWLINRDNIDTDMIFHNRYLSITDIKEMGQYTFDNLEGFKKFSSYAQPGDIIITGRNFGCGSSRQQAVDCFSSLGIKAIIAESFGSIYERNAINAAFPIIICKYLHEDQILEGDRIRVDLKNGGILNLRTGVKIDSEPFSDMQYEIYQRGGLLA